MSHSLCGNLTYVATFIDQVISSKSHPMSYDGAFRSFAFYSEDYDLIGKRLFFLQAFLTDYPTTVSAVEEAFIKILNPCINPNLVLGTPQMTLQPYLYS